MRAKLENVISQVARRNLRRGFTLVEILIVVVILGILASVVLPQFSDASHQARENTLKDDLRYLRTQVAVFKAQHRDVPPGYAAGDTATFPSDDTAFVEQLTKFSSEGCATSTTGSAVYRFGPYLTTMPSNPLNGKSAVKMTTDFTYDSSGVYGWLYNPVTQQIVANNSGTDTNGQTYISY